jgi:hypothetical protein
MLTVNLSSEGHGSTSSPEGHAFTHATISRAEGATALPKARHFPCPPAPYNPRTIPPPTPAC